jgi:hypothetical protein
VGSLAVLTGAAPSAQSPPPQSNRRWRYLVFCLVFLITGANVVSAIAAAHDSSARELPKPAAVQPPGSHYAIRQSAPRP